MGIPRGTTPTLTLTFPEGTDLTEAAHVYVSLKGGNLIQKQDADLTVSSTSIDVYLTQEETLSLSRGNVSVQVNWTYANGSRAASDIASFNLTENLLNGVVE